MFAWKKSKIVNAIANFCKLRINDAKAVTSPPTDPDIDKHLTVARVIVALE